MRACACARMRMCDCMHSYVLVGACPCFYMHVCTCFRVYVCDTVKCSPNCGRPSPEFGHLDFGRMQLKDEVEPSPNFKPTLAPKCGGIQPKSRRLGEQRGTSSGCLYAEPLERLLVTSGLAPRKADISETML